MNNDIEVVDKWAVIVGMPDKSGDPSLHLHRIYDYDKKQHALDNLKNLKGMYSLVFVQKIKCDKELY